MQSQFLLSIQCFGYITRECLPTPSYSPLHCALLIRDSNIDRLFAIWQALHNDTISNPTFVAPSDRSNGTRVIAGGPKQNADTPLAPFNASEKVEDFWTSAAAKDTKTFGHVYPETRDWVYKTPADIKSQLTSLYSY